MGILDGLQRILRVLVLGVGWLLIPGIVVGVLWGVGKIRDDDNVAPTPVPTLVEEAATLASAKTTSTPPVFVPVDYSLESLMPRCKFFEPFFSREQAGFPPSTYEEVPSTRVHRQCVRELMALNVGLIRFSSESQSSQWLVAAEKFWRDTKVYQRDGSYGPPSVRPSKGWEGIDRHVTISLGISSDCPIGGTFEYFGTTIMYVFYIGRFGVELHVDDCHLDFDDALKRAIEDYGSFTERLGTSFRTLEFRDHLVDSMEKELVSRILDLDIE